VERQWLSGVARERFAVIALGGLDVAAAMRVESALRQRVRREHSRRAERSVAELVALAASTGARVVAADDRTLCETALGALAERARLVVCREHSKSSSGERRRWRPLRECYAVADQLRELRRCRDRVRECGRERGEIVRRDDAAEVVETVKAERQSDRIGGLEREAIGERLAREADAVLVLEQRTERPADRDVLCVRSRIERLRARIARRRGQRNARILQRLEELARAQREAAVADAPRVVVPVPFRADVVGVEEGVVPRIGVDDISIPLHEEHARGLDVPDERFQDEARVVVARCERIDRDDVDARWYVDAVRNPV